MAEKKENALNRLLDGIWAKTGKGNALILCQAILYYKQPWLKRELESLSF